MWEGDRKDGDVGEDDRRTSRRARADAAARGEGLAGASQRERERERESWNARCGRT